MTAPLVYHDSRRVRDAARITRNASSVSYTSLLRAWVAETPGQLWQRVAEGQKQVWS